MLFIEFLGRIAVGEGVLFERREHPEGKDIGVGGINCGGSAVVKDELLDGEVAGISVEDFESFDLPVILVVNE